MRHALSRHIHDRWQVLRDDRSGAERGDVDPGAIRDVLPSAFVLDGDPVHPRRASFVLSGTRVDALFGRTLRGEDFAGIWSGPSLGRLGAALGGVLEGGGPVVAAVRGGPRQGGETAFELMLLPLGPAGGGRRRVLGSLAALRIPGWIGMAPAAPLHLLGGRALRDLPGRLPPAGAPVRIGRFTVHPGGRDRRSPCPEVEFSPP